MQEVLERTVSGHPVSLVVSDRLLLVGLLVQVAVAVVVATLLWLGRAAEAVGRAFARGRVRRHGRPLMVWPATAVRPLSRLRGVRGSRAPPRLATG